MSRMYEKSADSVVNYLNRAFSNAINKASSKLGRDNSSGTNLHSFQVEYCYLINSIQRDPEFVRVQKIQEANNLIDQIKELAPKNRAD